ncbi:hypothetical protein AM587_10000159 [Phytophthora nicotianae]|uniref:Uncharacterized protein n=1 Tax=Phytophthora nicotianae TaxID=4792 RepID=A0A0W8DXF4_PHYNI|nr:hypothetical protein AM587_10000159 [Phytophthora nicotianae]
MNALSSKNKKQLASFWNQGFFIQPMFSSDECTEALKELKKLDIKGPVFKEVYLPAQDTHRFQECISDFTQLDAISVIKDRVEKFVVGLNEKWLIRPDGWTALRSLPGGTKQGNHCDFPSFETSYAQRKQDGFQLQF